MHNQTFKKIHLAMHEYTAKGTKSGYKKKQMKRLVSIFEDIFENEQDSRLEAIGRRQIIGFWRRTEHEANKTRLAKYQILKRFFESFNKRVTVPKPKTEGYEKSN